MADWQEILDAELEFRDPVIFQKKMRERDNANFNDHAHLKLPSQTTASTTYVDLSTSIKIYIPAGSKKLNIRGKLGILGEETTDYAYVRFRISSTYSTEDSLQHTSTGSPTWQYKDPFICTLDVSALSGIQTLYIQGKIAGGTAGGMSGEITERMDSNWSLT